MYALLFHWTVAMKVAKTFTAKEYKIALFFNVSELLLLPMVENLDKSILYESFLKTNNTVSSVLCLIISNKLLLFRPVDNFNKST